MCRVKRDENWGTRKRLFEVHVGPLEAPVAFFDAQQARIVVPIVGVVILGALIGFSLWSGTEEDQVIFSNLSDRDLRMEIL